MLSHFPPTRPEYGIPVLLKSGLTNFSGCTVLAAELPSKEKFSAGSFCFFLMPKRKSLSAAASRGKTVVYGKRNQFYVTHIDLNN